MLLFFFSPQTLRREDCEIAFKAELTRNREFSCTCVFKMLQNNVKLSNQRPSSVLTPPPPPKHHHQTGGGGSLLFWCGGRHQTNVLYCVSRVGRKIQAEQEKLHLAVVACGDRIKQTMTMLRSAVIMTTISMPPVFHIFAATELQPHFKEQVTV